MKLYVVRHGQTDWNIGNKLQGSADIPLNARGIEQAYETKERLADREFDVILCSPLGRARQTAEIINEGRGLEILLDERLRERDFGEFEGVSKHSFDWVRFWSREENVQYERAENVRVFFRRVWDCLDDIYANRPEKRILVVCHGGVMRAVECYFAGEERSDAQIAQYTVENAGVREYGM